MTTRERIRRCILIEKMNIHSVYSRQLGLEDVSRFCGKEIRKEGDTAC